MQNDKVVSINNTTKVDLQGQAAWQNPIVIDRFQAPPGNCNSCAALMHPGAENPLFASPQPMRKGSAPKPDRTGFKSRHHGHDTAI